ncbi:hypothetical protein KY362_06895 [Candidatus Woesearchaeota archaeon]|nr:hypothetical protein [Candidatus Woesearchaeota archaeon]
MVKKVKIKDSKATELWKANFKHNTPKAFDPMDLPGPDIKRYRGIALGILRDMHGYIRTHDRERLAKALKSGVFPTIQEMGYIRARAERRKDAGLPPLWNPEFEGYGTIELTVKVNEFDTKQEVFHKFPTIDFVLTYGAGTYMRSRMKRGQDLRDGVKRGIEPAATADIEKFCTNALPPDGLLDKDIEFWTRYEFGKDLESPENLDAIVENTVRALDFLRTELADYPREEREEVKYDGGDIGFVKEPLWYLRFSETDRLKVVSMYKALLMQHDTRFVPNTTGNRMHYERMKFLFPDEFRDFEYVSEVEQQREAARAAEDRKRYAHIQLMADTADFSGMHGGDLKRFDDARDILYAFIEQRFEEEVENDPIFALKSNVSIGCCFGLQDTVYKDLEVSARMNELKAAVVRKMPADELRAAFKGEGRTLAGLISYDNVFSRVLREKIYGHPYARKN